jgi:hypothetical protein
MNSSPQMTAKRKPCCCIVHFPGQDVTCVVVKCTLET